MTKFKVMAAFTMLIVCGTMAHADEIDDYAIQTSDRSGGNVSVLTFKANQPGYFSITGRFNDVAIIDAKPLNNLPLPNRTVSIRQLVRNNPLPNILIVERSVQLADGRTRVFLRIDRVLPEFNGGSLTLRSDRGVVIDRDYISVSR
ncbi:MAG: hypothetical protein EBV06_00645 [Planctomycetia bacterium]|nr:hypothetical protein [Planctomycetia bacterium]